MRYAICNETFEGWSHARICKFIKSLGYDGLEIAPFTLGSRITDVSKEQRRELKHIAKEEGIEIIGLHWLLAKTTTFQLTSMEESVRRRTAEYLMSLAEATFDLGGTLMVLGSPAQRKIPEGYSKEDAYWAAIGTLSQCLSYFAEMNVCVCIEPLAPTETDFIQTAEEGMQIIRQLNHPNVQLHLDVKAMSSEAIPIPEIIQANADWMKHFHANDPNLRGPGFGKVEFEPIFQALNQVNYTGWVSVEVFDYSPDPETIARESIRYMREVESRI